MMWIYFHLSYIRHCTYTWMWIYLTFWLWGIPDEGYSRNALSVLIWVMSTNTDGRLNWCTKIQGLWFIYVWNWRSVGESTGARGTKLSPPPLLTFLFTYLFSIKFLYFFIISSFFPYFNLFVSIFIQSYASTKPIYCWHLWEKCELDFQKWEKCEQMPPMRSYLIVGIW